MVIGPLAQPNVGAANAGVEIPVARIATVAAIRRDAIFFIISLSMWGLLKCDGNKDVMGAIAFMKVI